MRRRTKLMAISGAILSISSLMIFSHILDQRTTRDFRSRSDRIAWRLCEALQGVELVFSKSSPAAGSSLSAEELRLASTLGLSLVSDFRLPRLQAGAAKPTRHFAQAGTPLVCTRRFPLTPLVMVHDASMANALLITSKTNHEPPAEWIRLLGRDLIAADPENVRLISLAPWIAVQDSRVTASHLYRIEFGEIQVGLNLAPNTQNEKNPERLLALTLGAIGVVLSGLIAYISNKSKKKEQRLLSSFRKDGLTPFLSRYALVKDLEVLSPTKSSPRQGDGLLVTIDFRFLERQNAFLSELENVTILTNACHDIAIEFPSYTDLNFYRVSEKKIALIVRSSEEIQIEDTTACESLLARLLGIVSGSIQSTSDAVLAWDDVIITGQTFRLDAPPSSLLTMQAFGELLATEDRRSFRLVERGDDQLVKEKGEIRGQLTCLTASDLDLRFQPILLIPNPGHFGLELLICFRPPALSKLGTGKVMQLAHDIGIAHQIDALVLSRLAEVQKALSESEVLRSRIEYVSVNISTDSVANDQRLNQLIGQLKKYCIDCSTYCIEITEMAATNLLSGSENVTTASERLIKELNLRIFIDDFGSGLSNYKRISEAWYDAIKLDIGLIKGIDRSFRLQRYVGSFIDTVHALGKTVVCEGVETYNEMTAAVRLGADAMQGFLIAHPMPLMDVETFLQTSEWASRDSVQKALDKIHASSRLLDSMNCADSETAEVKVPLERYILDNWSRLRSFEEFVLLFVNELKTWGLDIYRFSLAFLPDQDDIDCSQYVWINSKPGEVSTLRMERDFLEQEEHLCSPLHFIATRSKIFRQRPTSTKENQFKFLESLRAEGCSDYLGLRLDSRGVSIPVLTIALNGGSAFSDEEVQRIEAMSSLLSLLFHAFESERSKRLAMLDPLTELANRRSFDSFLKSNISACRLAQVNLSLALIDIDQFKSVNDIMGHAYGDRCLKEIAVALNESLRRKTDFVARLGGEEFAIILPNSDAETSLNLCEKLRQSILDKRIDHPGHEAGKHLTVSIGIAVWDPLSHAVCDADQLLQLADDCLYEAKRKGRNRVVCRSLSANLVSQPDAKILGI
jgi:diguanylate cyclase (GGDEF)-like protein